MTGDVQVKNRKMIRQEYGALFDTLSKILFDADPAGINFASNTDEYDPEVETILPRLKDAGTEGDIRQIIHEEFCRWFDAEIAGPVDAYAEIAEKFWVEWQRYRRMDVRSGCQPDEY